MISPRKIIPVIVAVLIIGGVLLPLGVYSISRWDSDGAYIKGTAISESRFGDFIADEVDSDMFPDAYKIVSERPYLVTRDYSPFTHHIDNETAISRATSFLEDVGPPLVDWSILAISKEESPPSWKIIFDHRDFSAFVVVDALLGRVIQYESRYLHEYDPTAITLEEAEDLVSQFLTYYNITIPSSARYIEGYPYDCQRFYSLVFQEYLGPIEVEDSTIVVRASAFTHGISYYHYNWIGLDSFDVTQIIDHQQALVNALTIYNLPEYLTNQSSESPRIVLANLYDGSGNLHHRLSWVFEFKSEIRNLHLYVDAFSGKLFGVRGEFEPYVVIQEQMIVGSTDFLLTIPVVSSIMLVVVSLISLWKFGGRKKYIISD